MLEYPLWYAYFLSIAAFLLGMLDSTSYRLELRRLGRLSIMAILLLGAVSLLQLQQGYVRLEQALTTRPSMAGDKAVVQRIREGLENVYGYPLLQPYAELFMNNWIEVSDDGLDNKLALNERALKFVPISMVAYRRAWLLALAGRLDEARLQLNRAIWSYPGDFPVHSEELKTLAQKDPARFAALLEFAIEKNKEYISAVSTK